MLKSVDQSEISSDAFRDRIPSLAPLIEFLPKIDFSEIDFSDLFIGDSATQKLSIHALECHVKVNLNFRSGNVSDIFSLDIFLSLKFRLK